MHESVATLKKDRHFTPLVKKYGAPDFTRGSNYFQALVRAIIYQQLSGKAAGTIYNRFNALFPGRTFPKPEKVLAVPPEKLRAVGLSNQKVAYIRDLATHCKDKRLNFKRFYTMTNDEIIHDLVAVKGIGVWSAHMFLLFTMNRPDILPVGDLGIRKGFQLVYKLRSLPSPTTMERLAKPWRPHASVASWYLWRRADEEKK